MEINNMAVMNVNNDNLNELKNSEKTVLLDFYADWCGPCRMLSPVLEEIAAEHPELIVGKVNVDEESALAMRFGISSIPYVALVQGGAVKASAMGFRPKQALLDALGL